LSYVHPEDLGLKEKVESFSGYFTVGNPKCDSNLFFWFFPAKVILPNVFPLHRCTVVETPGKGVLIFLQILLVRVLGVGKNKEGPGVRSLCSIAFLLANFYWKRGYVRYPLSYPPMSIFVP
jgi:hypothetical protein